MSSPLLETPTQTTFAEAATQKLRSLWGAVHGKDCPVEVRSLLSTVLAPWGSSPIPSVPRWPSDIGSDHSPLEFSLTLTPGAAELRVVVEAQGTKPGLRGTRGAALRLNGALAQQGADLGRFAKVRDLFLPDVSRARFALWHGVSLVPGSLSAKVYLNPQIRGAQHACALVKSALDRLDMGSAWPVIASASPGGPLCGDAIRYLSLDLADSAQARVKVYLYLAGASSEDLERIAAFRQEYVAGEVTEFCRAITGSTGPYASNPPCVYLAFTGNDGVPSDVTIQIPIAHYVAHDGVARDRIQSYLRSRDIDADTYSRALNAVASRPLNAHSGLNTYVSLRTGQSPGRVTTYFGAELYKKHAQARRL